MAFDAPRWWTWDPVNERRRELVGTIQVGLCTRDEQDARAHGRSPQTFTIRAMIDTGYSGSLLLSSAVLERLGAQPTGRTVNTWGTTPEAQPLKEYQVTAVLPFTSAPGGIRFRDCFVQCADLGFGTAARHYDAVIGMHLLGYCRLVVEGLSGTFQIEPATIAQADAPRAALPAHDDTAADLVRTLRDDVPNRRARLQVVRRVLVEGGGVNALGAVDVGDTILPVEDASAWYNPNGGTVTCGPQRITYTGIQDIQAGSLVGPGAGPASAPSTTTAPSGSLSGVYEYGYTDVTASGESLASPIATIAVGVSPSVAPGYSLDGSTGFGTGGWAIGDTVEIKYSYSRAATALDFTHEDPVSVSTGVKTLVAYPPDPTFIETPTITVPYSTDASVKFIHVWMSHNGGAFSDLWDFTHSSAPATINAIPNNSAGGTFAWYFDVRTLGDSIPTPAQQVALSGIAIGASGVTARKVYRTVAGGSQLKLLTTIADNTTTTYTDNVADGSLGTNAPTSDTSALTQPSGQVLAGSPTLLLAGAGAFDAAGGWVRAGNQVVRYTGISGNTLTGIPVSGIGAILATLSYNSTVTAAAALIGIPASGAGSIRFAIAQGDPVNLLVQEDDLAAQAELAAQIGGSGVIEDYSQDGRISETEARSRALARLALLSQPLVTIGYKCRDRLTASGNTVHVDLPSPTNVYGDFLIQQVEIFGFHESDDFYPTFQATAASSRATFEDLLRQTRKRLSQSNS
jgi:hypothetical protein